jgi:hypothetical protein
MSAYAKCTAVSVFVLDENLKRQIRKVIAYANLNVYTLDDVLDMKNGQNDSPKY